MGTSPDGERLRDRVRQLEQLVEQQADRIAELEAELEADRDTGGWSRRSILASAATAAGIGALTGRVQAAPSYSSATGQVGSSAEPVSDVITQSLRVNSAQVDGDLRLATGQSIKDDGGNPVLTINSSGNSASLRYSEADGVSRAVLRDDVGSFNAVEYVMSSSAPGTLELTNAALDAKNLSKFRAQVRFEASAAPSATPAPARPEIYLSDGTQAGSDDLALHASGFGRVVTIDSSGNVTVLS